MPGNARRFQPSGTGGLQVLGSVGPNSNPFPFLPFPALNVPAHASPPPSFEDLSFPPITQPLPELAQPPLPWEAVAPRKLSVCVRTREFARVLTEVFG